MSQEDVQALHQLESATRKVDSRYEVPMLWRHPNIRLPNNYSAARHRFNQLIRRLRAHPELYMKYKSVIDQLVAKGYARKMTKKEVDTLRERTWYPLINP